MDCSLPFKGIFKGKKKKGYPLNFRCKKISREPFQLICSLKAIVPIFKPDQNSVCCLLLNYVSLKHKCVSFRKLQISAFPYSLGEYNFKCFVLGRKNTVCIITQGSCQYRWPDSFFGSRIFQVLAANYLVLLTVFHIMADSFLFYFILIKV